MLRIQLAHSIDDRWVVCFRMRRRLLHDLRGNLRRLLRSNLRSATTCRQRDASGLRQLLQHARARAAGKQAIQEIGPLVRTRIPEELTNELSKGWGLIAAEHRRDSTGQILLWRRLRHLIEMIFDLPLVRRSTTLRVILQYTRQLIHPAHKKLI